MNGPAARIGLALGVLVSAAACSSYTIVTVPNAPMDPAAPPAAGFAEICVMRPHWKGFAVPTVVRDNGQLVGGLKGNSYFCYYAVPGLHEIVASAGDDVDRELGTTSDQHARIVVAAGEHHFLHHGAPGPFGMPPLTWVDAAEATRMLPDCRFAYVQAVPGWESLPARVPVAAAR